MNRIVTLKDTWATRGMRRRRRVSEEGEESRGKAGGEDARGLYT